MCPPSKQMVFRFAPSPNGLLHLGHAASALRNFEAAQRCGGRFLLRIEDIDVERCRPAFEAAILQDIAWLGLSWEQPVRRQSQHLRDYRAALDALGQRGLTYCCFCSRAEIAAKAHGRDPDNAPLYPRTCAAMSQVERRARLENGERAAVRLDMAKACAAIPDKLHWLEYYGGAFATPIPADPLAWGDVLIARKDIATSYHLAVTIDDALQGVTDVVRGADLFHATSVHRLLQALLDLPAPNYHHHALLLDGGGRKLSKSLASKSLQALRAEGMTPSDVRALVCGLPA